MEKLDKLLREVQNPSRYIGGEINSYNKEITEGMVRVALAFPDIYEIGMSYLGFQILYNLKNERDDIFCERVFSPWEDMEEQLRKNKMELYTLESKTPLKEMDFIGFTLQYELSYTNILNMLDLSNIPLRVKDRDDTFPIIFAGGPNAFNPEPLAEIIDLFVIGEGEEVNIELIELYKRMKKENIYLKEDYLKEASKIEGIYVPSLYEVDYNDDNTIKEFKPISSETKSIIKKRIIRNFDGAYYPKKVIVPFQDIVHDRAMIEIFRGCTRGCRFCQAGMLYRPIRERSKEDILEKMDTLLENTGFQEIALSSLSSLDHSEVKGIVTDFVDKYESKKIGLSLPSLRLDSFAVDLLKEIQKVRKTGLTFAAEAGTQRLRDVINKGVTEEDLFNTLREVFENGWKRVKLYFMLGLPTETYEDIEGIAILGEESIKTYYDVDSKLRRGKPTLTISTANFVPKPFTPFQWFGQDTVEELDEKHKFLKEKITNRNINYNYHGSWESSLEGIIARGDRKLNEVIIKAFELGCKFDGWREYFNYELWLQAFEELNIDPYFYSTRKREYSEILPWDHLDCGVTKEYLIKENEKANEEKLTVDCREYCTNCGVNFEIIGGDCYPKSNS
jgi:radical SAM family uncharacterized protein